MIQSKKDLKEYIEADLRSQEFYPLTLKMKMGGGAKPTNLEISD